MDLFHRICSKTVVYHLRQFVSASQRHVFFPLTLHNDSKSFPFSLWDFHSWNFCECFCSLLRLL
ncbi:hypothetical protein V6Z12_A13G035800 [Gossypium hirsutum]